VKRAKLQNIFFIITDLIELMRLYKANRIGGEIINWSI